MAKAANRCWETKTVHETDRKILQNKSLQNFQDKHIIFQYLNESMIQKITKIPKIAKNVIFGSGFEIWLCVFYDRALNMQKLLKFVKMIVLFPLLAVSPQISYLGIFSFMLQILIVAVLTHQKWNES